jgi:hypothetical protein
MWVGGQCHDLATLPPGKTCSVGGWLGPRAGLDGCGKFNPQTVQPIVSRYTEYCLSAHNYCMYL